MEVAPREAGTRGARKGFVVLEVEGMPGVGGSTFTLFTQQKGVHILILQETPPALKPPGA